MGESTARITREGAAALADGGVIADFGFVIDQRAVEKMVRHPGVIVSKCRSISCSPEGVAITQGQDDPLPQQNLGHDPAILHEQGRTVGPELRHHRSNPAGSAGFHVELGDVALGRILSQGSGENAIACHRIPVSGTIVEHRIADPCITARSIVKTVHHFDSGRIHPAGSHPGGDRHRLCRSGHCGAMEHICQSRCRRSDPAGIGSARSTQIIGDGERKAGPESMVQGLHDQTRLAAYPARVKSQGIAGIDHQIGKVHLAPVHFVIAMPVGEDVDFPVLDKAGRVRALENPAQITGKGG